MQDRQISKIEREFPHWLGQTKRTEKEGLCFFVKEEFGGGRIALRNLSDATSYKSAEFCDIAIEELTENQRDVFEDLVLFRLRTPGVERPCFLGGTNPTGKGLQWVKALWIDRKFPKELENLKQEFHYVPALLQDNPHLGLNYRESLMGLPEKKRRALLEGDWSIPEGQYFTNFEMADRQGASVHRQADREAVVEPLDFAGLGVQTPYPGPLARCRERDARTGKAFGQGLGCSQAMCVYLSGTYRVFGGIWTCRTAVRGRYPVEVPW